MNCKEEEAETVGERCGAPSVTAVTKSNGLVSGSWWGEEVLEWSRDVDPLFML
jgi:hypothetical protein